MKSISLSVSESVYEEYRSAAEQQGRPIAQLIREAMEHYRDEHLHRKERLADFPVFAGHRLRSKLPSRAELYDEAFGPDRTGPA